MTLIPKQNKQNCFKACDADTKKAGLCDCSNRPTDLGNSFIGDLKYEACTFTDGVFIAVWVEYNGEKIATFHCNHDNYEIAKNHAKILADTLNTL